MDWGSLAYLDQDGRKHRIWVFVMTLGWSRACYVELVRRADTAAFIQCHQCHVNAFEYLGGVPRRCLCDNAKVVTLGRDDDQQPVWNQRPLHFALRMGFEVRLCRPYRAQTKGKVESGVKYVKGHMWPSMCFTDDAGLNRQGLEWRDTVSNRRIHGTTHRVPWEVPGDRLGAGPPVPGESRAQAGRGSPGQHLGHGRQQAADRPIPRCWNSFWGRRWKPAESGISPPGPRWPTSPSGAPWSNSTSPSSPPSTSGRSKNWPVWLSSPKPPTSCSSGHPAWGRRTWRWPWPRRPSSVAIGAYFVRAYGLMEGLRKARAEHNLDRRLRICLAPKVLVVD